ncbi:hypothetical protein DYH09_30800, partial [bacterium CPR1]|nr:hypothetical protein [bacterium CPR1]
EERETVMELTTSWELKGREEGRKEGRKESIIEMLEHRFGKSTDLLTAVEAVQSDDVLKRLFTALLNHADREALSQILREPAA